MAYENIRVEKRDHIALRFSDRNLADMTNHPLALPAADAPGSAHLVATQSLQCPE